MDSVRKSYSYFVIALIAYAGIYSFFDIVVTPRIAIAFMKYNMPVELALYFGEILSILFSGLLVFIPLMGVLIKYPDEPVSPPRRNISIGITLAIVLILIFVFVVTAETDVIY